MESPICSVRPSIRGVFRLRQTRARASFNWVQNGQFLSSERRDMKTKEIVSVGLLGLLLCGCKLPKQPALGEPLAVLTPEQHARFQEGKKVFQRVFTPETGLGPLFNGNSCAECHETPVLGGVGDEVEVHATRFVPPNSCDPLF